MPLMPRYNKKATKIAFNILGSPGNTRNKSYKKVKSYSDTKNNPAPIEIVKIIRK